MPEAALSHKAERSSSPTLISPVIFSNLVSAVHVSDVPHIHPVNGRCLQGQGVLEEVVIITSSVITMAFAARRGGSGHFRTSRAGCSAPCPTRSRLICVRALHHVTPPSIQGVPLTRDVTGSVLHDPQRVAHFLNRNGRRPGSLRTGPGTPGPHASTPAGPRTSLPV